MSLKRFSGFLSPQTRDGRESDRFKMQIWKELNKMSVRVFVSSYRSLTEVIKTDTDDTKIDRDDTKIDTFDTEIDTDDTKTDSDDT